MYLSFERIPFGMYCEVDCSDCLGVHSQGSGSVVKGPSNGR